MAGNEQKTIAEGVPASVASTVTSAWLTGIDADLCLDGYSVRPNYRTGSACPIHDFLEVNLGNL